MFIVYTECKNVVRDYSAMDIDKYSTLLGPLVSHKENEVLW